VLLVEICPHPHRQEGGVFFVGLVAFASQDEPDRPVRGQPIGQPLPGKEELRLGISLVDRVPVVPARFRLAEPVNDVNMNVDVSTTNPIYGISGQ
jgi:hypothetical protein